MHLLPILFFAKLRVRSCTVTAVWLYALLPESEVVQTNADMLCPCPFDTTKATASWSHLACACLHMFPVLQDTADDAMAGNDWLNYYPETLHPRRPSIPGRCWWFAGRN